VLSTGQEMNALKTIPLARPRRECKPSNARYSVSNGRETCGVVNLVDGVYVATDTDGVVVGQFPTLREASRAFDDGGER
jgi:hypothetical protein